MTDFRGFRGVARPLDDIDLPRLGYEIGVGEDEIHAVIDVETSGGAWDARNRPKMLFEPHRFYKNLGPGANRDRAEREGLAYPSWGEKPYPKDSYPRLQQAMAIDETAALKSASWGLGQILGENHEMVGYDSVQDMVLATLDDADQHLKMMVDFIKSARLDAKLRAHDWAGFARGYNGPQYAKNGYHTKLAAAFARWSKIRDTPWSPLAAQGELVVGTMTPSESTTVGTVSPGEVVFEPQPTPVVAAPDPVTSVVVSEPPAPPVVVPTDLPAPSTSRLDLARYSKMFGSLFGVLVGWAVSQSLVPESLAGILTPQNLDLLSVAIGGTLGTFLAPANAPVVKKAGS